MISAQIAADELLRDLNLQNIKFKDKQRIAKNILDHFRQVIIVEFLHRIGLVRSGVRCARAGRCR